MGFVWPQRCCFYCDDNNVIHVLNGEQLDKNLGDPNTKLSPETRGLLVGNGAKNQRWESLSWGGSLLLSGEPELVCSGQLGQLIHRSG